MKSEDKKAKAEDIAERLRQTIEQKKMAREEIADRLGTSVSNVAIWSSGITPINRCRALALEAACNLNAEWLLTGKGSQAKNPPNLNQQAMKFAKDFENLPHSLQSVAKELLVGLSHLNPKKQRRRPGRPSRSSLQQQERGGKG